MEALLLTSQSCLHGSNFVFMYLKEWVMEQWENNFYISALAGAANGSSVVVMSKG